jgi:hypothetical protein
MPSLGLKFRAAALLAAGALAVHQLRYLLAYGHGSHQQLALQGHAYLTVFAPVVAGVLMLAAVELLVKVACAGRGSSGEPALPTRPKLWALASTCLLLVYASQEWIEGQLAPGHPAGPAGVLGHGGWLAVVLSAIIGLFVALALRGAGTAIEHAARRNRPRSPRSDSCRAPRLPVRARKPALDVLSLFLAARGPPLTSV